MGMRSCDPLMIQFCGTRTFCSSTRDSLCLLNCCGTYYYNLMQPPGYVGRRLNKKKGSSLLRLSGTQIWCLCITWYFCCSVKSWWMHRAMMRLLESRWINESLEALAVLESVLVSLCLSCPQAKSIRRLRCQGKAWVPNWGVLHPRTQEKCLLGGEGETVLVMVFTSAIR